MITVSLDGMENIFKELADKLEEFKSLPSVDVGVKDGVSYPDGTSVEVVGFVNEYGSEARGIPERSFIRSTMIENTDKYQGILRKIANKVIEDPNYNPYVSMGQLGLIAESDIKSKITDLKDPPNAESTIKRKKSDNPLLDTGLLRRSIINRLDGEE